MNNSLTNQKPKFSVVLASDGMQKLINNTYRDPSRAKNFVANVSSMVANNPDLQRCEASTIITSAMTADGLNLSLSNALGHCYVLPFNDNKRGRVVATFQLGYRGYLQLAMRSGYYTKLNVAAIKEGEIKKIDVIKEIYEFDCLPNLEDRKKAKTVGYYGFFETKNGFRKEMYWSKEEMEIHALTYSKGYKAKKGYTFWEKNFDAMACKTILRQLLSKWGVMSIELQNAFEKDTSYKSEDGKTIYFDGVDNANDDFESGIDDGVVEEPIQQTQQQVQTQEVERPQDVGYIEDFPQQMPIQDDLGF